MTSLIQYNKFKPIWEPIAKAEQLWRVGLNDRPLTIEIGPGVGLHPIQYAKQHPDRYIVAIEKTTEKFNKFSSRRQHHPQLDNIWPVHANAIEWITRNIGLEEVDEYFLLYPNPYPKESQRNKRLMHMPFMEHLIATMRIGAILTMATNIESFYQEAKDAWQQISCFNMQQDLIINSASHIARTHFERKYLAAGQTCYQLVFSKIGSLTSN